MSARACSRGDAPGPRYPDIRTLVVLCRSLGAALPCSDKPKGGAATHPVQEVCAVDRGRSRRRQCLHCHCLPRARAPRSATDRRPARAFGIRYTSAPELPGAEAPSTARWYVRARKPKTRAEPSTTLPLSGSAHRTPPLPKLPTCHPGALFLGPRSIALHSRLYVVCTDIRGCVAADIDSPAGQTGREPRILPFFADR